MSFPFSQVTLEFEKTGLLAVKGGEHGALDTLSIAGAINQVMAEVKEPVDDGAHQPLIAVAEPGRQLDGLRGLIDRGP